MQRTSTTIWRFSESRVLTKKPAVKLMPPFYQRATNNSSVQCTYTFPRRSQLVDEKI